MLFVLFVLFIVVVWVACCGCLLLVAFVVCCLGLLCECFCGAMLGVDDCFCLWLTVLVLALDIVVVWLLPGDWRVRCLGLNTLILHCC